MKIFISWSGNRSKAVAEFLHGWIRRVLQACRPWISTDGIERGAVWYNEIRDQLSESAHGIVVLTQDNKVAPWIMFESGSLARGLTNSRVLTFLVDLQPKDIEGPLAQFNHTSPDKEGVRKLVETLNNHLGSNRLMDSDLANVFETYWPQFETMFSEILGRTNSRKAPVGRGNDEILAEILENTRQLRNLAQEQRTYEIAPAEAERPFIRRGASNAGLYNFVQKLRAHLNLGIGVEEAIRRESPGSISESDLATVVSVLGPIILRAGYRPDTTVKD